jgi:hypothetical protein
MSKGVKKIIRRPKFCIIAKIKYQGDSITLAESYCKLSKHNNII